MLFWNIKFICKFYQHTDLEKEPIIRPCSKKLFIIVSTDGVILPRMPGV